jgi:hypothetical protein
VRWLHLFQKHLVGLNIIYILVSFLLFGVAVHGKLGFSYASAQLIYITLKSVGRALKIVNDFYITYTVIPFKLLTGTGTTS